MDSGSSEAAVFHESDCTPALGALMIANHRVDPDYITLFIVYVTVVIGVSLLVYIFGLKNKSETVLDREQGSAWVLSR